MTQTLISLISIFVGIIGGNIAAVIFKKYSFGVIGNTIAGVFGSIFFTKMFGRLGFDPFSIMKSGTFNLTLLIINIMVSFFGGAIGLIAINWLKNKMNR